MRNLLIYGIVIILGIFLVSCETDNTNTPVTQEIVYSDTSLITGELSVEVLYFDPIDLEFKPAPSGTEVHLYASYDDINNNLPLYSLQTTTSNSVYFGFINYGNYYVLGLYEPNPNIYYEGISVVQVRPRRQEWLTLTMYNTATK